MNRLLTTAFLIALPLLSNCKKSTDGDQQPTKQPAPKAPVAELIQGYWLPSADSLFEMEKAALEANPPEGGIDEKLLAEMRDQIEKSVEAFILHFEDGKTRALSDERVETGTYKLTGVDETAGTFTAALAEDGGETVTGAGKVAADALSLSTMPGMPPMLLNRSTKEEWDRRMDALNN